MLDVEVDGYSSFGVGDVFLLGVFVGYGEEMLDVIGDGIFGQGWVGVVIEFVEVCIVVCELQFVGDFQMIGNFVGQDFECVFDMCVCCYCCLCGVMQIGVVEVDEVVDVGVDFMMLLEFFLCDCCFLCVYFVEDCVDCFVFVDDDVWYVVYFVGFCCDIELMCGVDEGYCGFG